MLKTSGTTISGSLWRASKACSHPWAWDRESNISASAARAGSNHSISKDCSGLSKPLNVLVCKHASASKQGNRSASIHPSIPRTAANHAAAERDRRQPVKAVFAGYHRRGESRPWLDHTRPTASPKIVSCLCCTCMISVPLVIMPFPRPPMAGARSHRVA
jgi:hypothetical protein